LPVLGHGAQARAQTLAPFVGSAFTGDPECGRDPSESARIVPAELTADPALADEALAAATRFGCAPAGLVAKPRSTVADVVCAPHLRGGVPWCAGLLAPGTHNNLGRYKPAAVELDDQTVADAVRCS